MCEYSKDDEDSPKSGQEPVHGRKNKCNSGPIGIYVAWEDEIGAERVDSLRRKRRLRGKRRGQFISLNLQQSPSTLLACADVHPLLV